MVPFTPAGIAAYDTDADGLIDVELTRAEDVLASEAMGYVTIRPANFYFECLVIPSRRSR